MPPKIRGRVQSPSGRDNRGYILTIAVIIIASVISVVLIGTTTSTISHLDRTAAQFSGIRAHAFAESCLEEALIHLNRNNAYTGNTPSLMGGTCTATVTGTGPTRIVSITATTGGDTLTLAATVTIAPFEVTAWDL